MRPGERAKVIKDNWLCPFCLLHDETKVCQAKANKSKLACDVPECGRQHVLCLHELLKDMVGREGKVNVVKGGDDWKTLEEAWMEDERERKRRCSS
jgi:hypothetical protein